MKFVGLTSGGKDSYYAVMECLRNGHTLVACAHLAPHPNSPSGEESYMYQTAASEAVQIQVEECLGVPLLVRACRGKSRRTTLVYELECQHDNDGDQEDEDEGMDEVEDMYELLKEVQRTYPEVEAVSSGSILSTYQRVRVESVCQRLGWTSLGYLWRAGTQRQLLDTMLADEMEAVLVRVACPPLLLPQRHLNKTLRQLQDCGLFPRLEARLDFAVCGEGGEYETLVLDCPIFLKRLVLDSVSIQVDDDSDDGIGVLKIHSCHAEPKSSTSLWNLNGPVLCDRIQRPGRTPISSSLLSLPIKNSIEPKDAAASLSSSSYPAMTSKKTHYLAQYKILSCGLVHMSEIMSFKCYPRRKVVPDETKKLTTPLDDDDDDDEAESLLAVQEALDIFEILRCTLESLGVSTLDVVFVHLYLTDMGLFEQINRHYSDFFGTVLPPSRSCVSLGKGVLPGGRRVSLDCMAQRGSGLYLRSVGRPNKDNDDDDDTTMILPGYVEAALENRLHPLRSVLHVQSISHWAPVCVGPYSQCNTLRSSLHCLAGQIGLQPRTMTLVDEGGDNCATAQQLAQCWTNCASVLDALDGSTLQDSILGATIYLTKNDHDNHHNNPVHIPLSQASIANNGGIVPGAIDTSLFGKQQDTTDDFGGYEDEETYLAMTGGGGGSGSENDNDPNTSVPENRQVPLLTLVVSQLPKGALAEVELICATQLATSFLNVQTHVGMPPKPIKAMSAADPFWAAITTSSNDSHGKSGVQWNTGYDVGQSKGGSETHSHVLPAALFDIFATCRYVGLGCAAVVTVAASPSSPQEDTEESHDVSDAVVVDMEEVIYTMFMSYQECLYKAGLQLDSTFHIRFFYTIGTNEDEDDEDGMKLRQTVQSVVGSMWKRGNRPACSMVPVQGILLSHNQQEGDSLKTHSCGWAMQIMAADLLHMETDLWVHHHQTT
eukprot:scaffold108971_cov47-Attheya_sp.AAC.1